MTYKLAGIEIHYGEGWSVRFGIADIIISHEDGGSHVADEAEVELIMEILRLRGFK